MRGKFFMKKTKHNLPKKKKGESNFIEFSKVQANYLMEVRRRQQQELNDALGSIYEELGIKEKILQAPPGTFVLRKDFSGLDVLPVISVPKVGEKPEPEKPTEPQESGDKGELDN